MVCHTGSGVGTTAGREIRVEAKLPARDLSLLPQRRSVTSAGPRSAPRRSGGRLPNHHVVRTAFNRAINILEPNAPTPARPLAFFAHFGTNRAQRQTGTRWRCGMRLTIKPMNRQAEYNPNKRRAD